MGDGGRAPFFMKIACAAGAQSDPRAPGYSAATRLGLSIGLR